MCGFRVLAVIVGMLEVKQAQSCEPTIPLKCACCGEEKVPEFYQADWPDSKAQLRKGAPHACAGTRVGGQTEDESVH